MPNNNSVKNPTPSFDGPPENGFDVKKPIIAILALTAIVILALAASFFVANFNENLSDTVGETGASSEFSQEYRSAIQSADPSILSALPDPALMSAETTEDIKNLFDTSRLTYSFRIIDTTIDYLVKIVDSKSPEAEPFKPMAAYFILHTYYDSGRDLQVMIDAIEKSEFMSQLTTRAHEIAPEAFILPLEEMSYYRKSLYLSSYFVALEEQVADTLAIPANASYELAQIYEHLEDYDRNDVTTLRVKSILNGQLQLSVRRLDEVFGPGFTGIVNEHEMIVGLNNLAMATELLREAELENEFPVIKNLNVLQLYETSYNISRRGEAPGLEMFTTYLYARYLAQNTEANAENDALITKLVRKLVGVPPFSKVTEYSWATERILGSLEKTGTIYGKESIYSIARRSELMSQFLRLRAGLSEDEWAPPTEGEN